MAVGMLERKLEEAERLSGEALPDEPVLRLKHMIVSHHGAYDFGSPKLPMTLEAVALYYLDNLDAKIHSFDQLMHNDPNVDSPWTSFHHGLGGSCSRVSPKIPRGRTRCATTPVDWPLDWFVDRWRAYFSAY